MSICRGPRRKWRLICNCTSPLRTSLNIVNVVLKTPSSFRSTAPIECIDSDNKIASQISSLAKSVDNKLISMSEGLFSNLVTC